jgi:dTDP-L-rhamnose 4-epimerase
VRDVAHACLLALQTDRGIGGVFNIGSGESRTILSVAHDLARAIGKPSISPQVPGKYRLGDIRHCFADIAKAEAELGYSPQVDFQSGLEELAEWLADQVAEDSVEAATAELESRGLVA